MHWGVIVGSSVMLVVLDAEVSRIIRVRVPSIKGRRLTGDEPWFDHLSRDAFRRKPAACHRWKSLRTPANSVLFRESQREANASYANAHC